MTRLERTGQSWWPSSSPVPLGGWLMTPAFHLLYTVPVVNVPNGFDANGVPTCMRIAARAYDDLTSFRVAAAYSQAMPRLLTGDLLPTFTRGESMSD